MTATDKAKPTEPDDGERSTSAAKKPPAAGAASTAPATPATTSDASDKSAATGASANSPAAPAKKAAAGTPAKAGAAAPAKRPTGAGAATPAERQTSAGEDKSATGDKKATGDKPAAATSAKPDKDAPPAGDAKPTTDAKPDTDAKPGKSPRHAKAKDAEPAEDAKDDAEEGKAASTAAEEKDSPRGKHARRRRRKRGPAPAGSRWSRWYWVVGRGVATAVIGVCAIMLGVYVLPHLTDTNFSANQDRNPTPDTGDDQLPGIPLPDDQGTPGPTPTTTLSPAPPGTAQTQPGRPADALSTWALEQSALGIPQVALQAYGYAATVVERTLPSCHLSWTLLAGIGSVESNHGRHGGSALQANGLSQPKIIGIQLDGSASERIADTDQGTLDEDKQYDRAMGAMQFIPSTWKRYQVDADNDGRTDPYDLDDAALASAYYLCAGGRDLGTGAGWWSAVLSYNNLTQYATKVYAEADRYGRTSSSGATTTPTPTTTPTR